MIFKKEYLSLLNIINKKGLERFQNICLDKEGYIVSTDSHVLVRIKIPDKIEYSINIPLQTVLEIKKKIALYKLNPKVIVDKENEKGRVIFEDSGIVQEEIEFEQENNFPRYNQIFEGVEKLRIVYRTMVGAELLEKVVKFNKEYNKGSNNVSKLKFELTENIQSPIVIKTTHLENQTEMDMLVMPVYTGSQEEEIKKFGFSGDESEIGLFDCDKHYK